MQSGFLAATNLFFLSLILLFSLFFVVLFVVSLSARGIGELSCEIEL
jgi:hypothetical protein